MNLLSNVSSIKVSESITSVVNENSALVSLPPTNAFQNNVKIEGVSANWEAFQQQFFDAKHVDQQVIAVNILIKEFQSATVGTKSCEHLCQMVTDLWFFTPPKHPVRNSITRGLRKVNGPKLDLVIQIMSTTIKDRNDQLIQQHNANKLKAHVINDFLVSLNGCYDNLPAAVRAVNSCFLDLLDTFDKSIEMYIETLKISGELAPIERSEKYIFLHNVIRLTLSCVQQYPSKLNDNKILETMIDRCWVGLMENDIFSDLPTDTKVNIAILKTVNDRLNGNIYSRKDSILSQFELDAKKMFYGIAVINTIGDDDLEDPNFCLALKAITEKMIEYGITYTMDSVIIILLIRVLTHYSKKILQMVRKVGIPENDRLLLQETLRNCLDFAWLIIQHSLDNVRYFVKELFKGLLRFGKENPTCGDLIENAISKAKCCQENDPLFTLIVDHLCQVSQTERLVASIPDMQQRILNNIFMEPCWPLCYEHLMLNNLGEVDLQVWCERWIKPLLCGEEINRKSDDNNQLNVMRGLFESLLKAKPEASDYILASPNVSMDIYLFVLWILRKSGSSVQRAQLSQVSSDKIFVVSKVHHVDEIRVLSFRIIVESHKTSEPFSNEDFREILEFIKYSCSMPSPSVRQQITTTMKRAMGRIECGYSLAKKTSPSAKICQSYELFLKKLIDFCIDFCLFGEANYGRRLIGLKILNYAIQTWQTLLPNNLDIYSEKLWLKLQKSLDDSYEVIKDNASEILFSCSKFYPKSAKMLFSLNDLKNLVCSVRPNDTNTAAHYIVFCSFHKIYFENYCEAIYWCEQMMADGLEKSEIVPQSIAVRPMYGLILCTRYICRRIDFNDKSIKIEQLRESLKRIIEMCQRFTALVSSIVNNAAPEGHIPNDESLVSDEGNITPQMILVNAWRTVKEVSLLFGEIALRTPILTSNSSSGLITGDQLLNIGVHLQQLLMETKHRGAFEQTYVGFTNVCLRMWRSNDAKLHSFPMKIVQEIVAMLSGEESCYWGNSEVNLKMLCATRRSAGIPYMVQAILTSEIQVGSTAALRFCVSSILNIAKNGHIQEARTHALNILRMLFRCTDLGEIIGEFISDGVECSICGYSAPTWPERNSSALLFSALIVRIFGVHRTKGTEVTNFKNKMTGRVFFSKFPRLYDFFLIELQKASEGVQQNERPQRLNPLLVLISRLYPSSNEMNCLNQQLSTFIPFISTCGFSPELVTRQLSAKAVVALTPVYNIVSRLSYILNELKTENSPNTIHGYLLQILYLTRSIRTQNYDICGDGFIKFVVDLCSLKLEQHAMIEKAYIETILEILLNHRIYPIQCDIKQKLIEVRNRYFQENSNQRIYIMKQFLQKSITILNLLINRLDLCISDKQPKKILVVPFVESTANHESLETLLNIRYLMLLKAHKIVSHQEFTRYEIDMVDFIFSHNKDSSQNILPLLPSINDLYFIIQNQSRFDATEVAEAFEILSTILKFEHNNEIREESIETILELIKSVSDNEDESEDIYAAKWKFIAAHLSRLNINLLEVDKVHIAYILHQLRSLSQIFKPTNLKQTAAEALAVLCQYLKKKPVDLGLLTSYSEHLLALLRDDDEYIRNIGTEIITDLLDLRYIRDHTTKVVPSAAEDFLLEFLDETFIATSPNQAWSNWLDLLRLITASRKEEACGDTEAEIFEANKSSNNITDFHVTYKCYMHVITAMEKAAAAQSDIQKIRLEFPFLCDL